MSAALHLVELPIDPESAFPAKLPFGVSRKQKEDLLQGLLPLLGDRLAEGETILYVARGRASKDSLGPSRVVVLTNQRLLVCAEAIVRDVALGAIERVIDEFPRLKVLLRDGQFFSVSHIADAAHVFAAITKAAATVPALAPDAIPSLARTYCPRCVTAVPSTATACPNPECRAPYRRMRTAILRTLIFPGLGHFYFREWSRGIMFAFTSALTTALFVQIFVSQPVVDPGAAAFFAALMLVAPRLGATWNLWREPPTQVLLE